MCSPVTALELGEGLGGGGPSVDALKPAIKIPEAKEVTAEEPAEEPTMRPYPSPTHPGFNLQTPLQAPHQEKWAQAGTGTFLMTLRLVESRLPLNPGIQDT